MTVVEISDWYEDILGPDFHARDINLGPDPEGEGDIVATLVRFGEPAASQSAVLWVHGMTDYFFHEHVARALDEAGHAFYALDLRKCGRSCREGQRWHYSEDFRHYFPELTVALDLITAEHPDVTPIAHSTAGMIVPLWAAHLARNDSARHAKLGGIILNSPWLDMMYPKTLVKVGRPVIRLLGRLLPGVEVPGGNLGAYGMSLHRDHHGEWEFDVVFKPVRGHRKYLGWLREVLQTQNRVHRGEIDVQVPVLTLCSTESHLGQPFSEASVGVDTVLDTRQIQRWAPELGDDVTVHPIKGAMHDVFLSKPEPLAEALSTTIRWLGRR